MANQTLTPLQLKNVRLSYPHLFDRNPLMTSGNWLSTKILMPKNDPQTIMFLQAMRKISKDVFGSEGLFEASVRWQDGDLPGRSGVVSPDTQGHFLFTAKTKEENKAKLALVDRNRNAIIDRSQIYGGIWANVNLALGAYKDQKFGNQFTIYLNGVQKVRDDVPFGNGSVGGDGFDNLDEDSI